LTNRSGKKLNSNPLQPAEYQLIPLVKLLHNGFNSVLISDGVGVGKTISACYILSFLQSALSRPSLILCPPLLVDKWLLELKEKFDIKGIPIRTIEELPTAIGETYVKNVKRSQTYVMTNSLLSQNVSFDFNDLGLIIFDEIHNYRNQETVSHRAALRLSEKASNRIGLSATPINNSIEDFVSELNILLPNIEREVLNLSINESWGKDPGIVTLPLVTRFTKERLGIHFARRIIKQYEVAYPSNYTEKVTAYIQAVREKNCGKASFFEDVTYFRMAASSPIAISKALENNFYLETDMKMQILKEFICDTASNHVLLFCEFEETAYYIDKNIVDRECYVITGSIPIFERQAIIEAFKQSDKALLVMTPVGTEGLDLQFCDTVVNYDLHWNPMKIEQRIGRIDRIGQKKNEIFIINFIVENSIDSRVISVLQNKLKLIKESIFETGEIIRIESPHGGILVDPISLEKEMSIGQNLISAISLSNTIPERDYEVLKYVKMEYCSPMAISDAGKRNLRSEAFLENREQSQDWFTQNDDKADKLRDLISFYK